MAGLDLFGNSTIVQQQEEENIQNDNLELFSVSVSETPVTPEPINELGLQIRDKQTTSNGASINISPAYFGRSFEYAGIWEEGKQYYNDEHRTSFVTFENFLLACNKTHESSGGTKPKIIYYEGTPMGVENIYWTIALTGNDAGSDTITIERSLANLKKVVYSNTDSITSTNGVLSTVGQNVNSLLTRATNLETDNTQNKSDIKVLQDALSANIMYPIILSEDEYDALAVKDPNKFYYVYEE